MNSALPLPVVTGTKRPTSPETWIAHGATVAANAAASSAAAGIPERTSASSASTPPNSRYSGRASAPSPISAPGASHAHAERRSCAHRNASTAPGTATSASGSLSSRPVLNTNAGYVAASSPATRPTAGPPRRRPSR